MAVNPQTLPTDSPQLDCTAAHNAEASVGPTHSLGARMVVATLVFCMLFTVAIAAVRTWSAWQTNVAAMSAELELIAQVYQRTLSKSIWEMDRESLQAHMDSVANVSSVGQIEVSLQSANRAPEIFRRTRSGWDNAKRAPVLRIKLDYEPFAGSKETVGELVLSGDERVLWARLRAEVQTILVTQVTQSLLLASVIMLLFSRLVTVHVRRIARHLGQLTPSNLGQTLQLDRAPARRDELSQLVVGVNQLQNNLSSYLQQQQHYEQELASHRDHLADMVRERTSELENANALLDDLARTDPLTGLANRRHFDKIKELELRRAQRTLEPLTLLVCDIDCFKGYNDTYGHAAGDQCLRAVADAMRISCARAGDVVARIGGEEFAVLLPATDTHHGLQLASQLLQAVTALHIEHRDSDAAPHVTISIGLAQLDPAHNTRFETLFEQADQALYRAKSNGRNQVAHYAAPAQ